MVAAPFKATIKGRFESGRTIQFPCTVSDVNGEYYVFPDGNNDVILSASDGVFFVEDILLSAAGTDTSQAQVFVNGKNTGEVVMNAANVYTAISRQFQGSPIAVAPGARLRIKQLT